MKPELVTTSDSDRPRAFRRLSAPQKWEIVRLFSAGLLSTVLFATPLFLVKPTRTVAVASAPSAAAGAVTVVSELQVAPLTAEPVAAATAAPRRPSRTRASALPRAENRGVASIARADNSWPRKFARAMAGDGRYSVRPFPTVDASQR